jgi:hypothetical protein
MTDMLRAITGWLAMLGAVSLAHAASGPQPITQYETPAGARWAPFSSDLPKCDDTSVITTISGRFDDTETAYWGGRSAIYSFERMREIGFRANGLSYIPRRYCVARVTIVDPRVPPPPHPETGTVVYNVIAADGIIGWSWGVEWCVVGFDREHAYEPACHVLRPILERWLGETESVEYGLKARY